MVRATASVVRGDETHKLAVNQSIYIEKGQKHRLSNHSDEPLIVIETQIGNYLGEDDIVRYEDIYSRQ